MHIYTCVCEYADLYICLLDNHVFACTRKPLPMLIVHIVGVYTCLCMHIYVLHACVGPTYLIYLCVHVHALSGSPHIEVSSVKCQVSKVSYMYAYVHLYECGESNVSQHGRFFVYDIYLDAHVSTW